MAQMKTEAEAEKKGGNEIQMAQITVDRARAQAKIKLIKNSPLKRWNCRPKEMELQAQAQVHTDPTSNLHSPNIDAKSPKLPVFVDEKD